MATATQFEVVRPLCAGLDVHKKTLVAAVCETDMATSVASYKLKTFNTTNADVGRLCDWLITQDVKEVCMESTGKYWIPIFDILESKGLKVTLTHPKYVKAIKGKKTDKRDARWIANLFRFDIVKSSFVLGHDLRGLRELIRYRGKLSNMETSEKNRFQNCMTVSKIRLDCILSDSFGVSGKRVMKYLLSGLPFDEKICKELIDPRVKADPEEVMEYIRGFKITGEERSKMKHVNEHLDFIGTSIIAFDEEINYRSAKFQKQIELLGTIPGIKRRTAVSIIAEIGTDMSVFGSSRRLCSWAGLVPADNASANKKKSTRCSNGGRYVKPKLVECAFAAVKNKENPYFMNKYKKLVKRKGKKKAIIAIARMMLTCIYNILDKNEAFAPSDYKAIINQEPEEKRVHQTVENSIQYLREQGADEETLKLIAAQCSKKSA